MSRRIYEQLGRKDEAVRMYALALNAARPSARTRTSLAALVGGEQQVDRLAHQYRDELTRECTITVDGRVPDGATADTMVLLGRHSVEGVKFVDGDDRLRPVVEAVRTTTYEAVFPDDTPAKIVRRATVFCSTEHDRPSCRLVLQLPHEAQLAEQK